MQDLIMIYFISYDTVANPENQWRDGDHGEKMVFDVYSRQYDPYFLVFVEEN